MDRTEIAVWPAMLGGLREDALVYRLTAWGGAVVLGRGGHGGAHTPCGGAACAALALCASAAAGR